MDPFFEIPEPRAALVGAGRPAPFGRRGGYQVRFAVRGDHQDSTPTQVQAITVVPGEPAYLMVTNQTAYVSGFRAESVPGAWIADPTIDMIDSGLLVQALAVEGARDDEAVLGYRATFSDLERPLALRNLELMPGERALTLQMPSRTESEAIGVRTLKLGTESLLTHLPVPGGTGSLLLYATIVEVPLEPPTESAAGFDEEQLDPALAELVARSRSLDDPTGSIRLALVEVDAVLPLGEPVEAEAVRHLVRGTTSPAFVAGVDTNLTAGVRLGTRTERAFVADYGTQGTARGLVWWPVIEGHVSGVEAFLRGDDALRVVWTTRPLWSRDHVETEHGPLEIDVPRCQEHDVIVPLTEGDRVIPIVRLDDDRTAAVWVRFER